MTTPDENKGIPFVSHQPQRMMLVSPRLRFGWTIRYSLAGDMPTSFGPSLATPADRPPRMPKALLTSMGIGITAISLRAKQILKLPNVLTSEDLWDIDGTPREPGKPYNPVEVAAQVDIALSTMKERVAEWKMSPKEFQEKRMKQRQDKKKIG